MKLFFSKCLLFICPLLLAACTNTTPQIVALNSVSDGFTTNTSITTSTWQNVAISGTCSAMVAKITFNFEGLEQEVPCINNYFSKTLTKSDLTGLSSGSTTNIFIKALDKMGITKTYTVVVTYLPTQQISQEILAGSATQSDGTYKLKSRIRFQKQTAMEQGNYRLRGWVR